MSKKTISENLHPKKSLARHCILPFVLGAAVPTLIFSFLLIQRETAHTEDVISLLRALKHSGKECEYKEKELCNYIYFLESDKCKREDKLDQLVPENEWSLINCTFWREYNMYRREKLEHQQQIKQLTK